MELRQSKSPFFSKEFVDFTFDLIHLGISADTAQREKGQKQE